MINNDFLMAGRFAALALTHPITGPARLRAQDIAIAAKKENRP